MKKIIIALLCAVLLFAGCSGKESIQFDESGVANYVGEGQLTVIRFLLKSNAYIVKDVLISGHLPVDESSSVTNENGTFAPVVSDKIKTYEDLKKLLYSTYIPETADRLLVEQEKYVEIDGKLYLDMNHSEVIEYEYDWSEPEISVESVSEDKYTLNIKVKKGKIGKQEFSVNTILSDGNIRLENILL